MQEKGTLPFYWGRMEDWGKELGAQYARVNTSNRAKKRRAFIILVDLKAGITFITPEERITVYICVKIMESIFLFADGYGDSSFLACAFVPVILSMDNRRGFISCCETEGQIGKRIDFIRILLYNQQQLLAVDYETQETHDCGSHGD